MAWDLNCEYLLLYYFWMFPLEIAASQKDYLYFLYRTNSHSLSSLDISEVFELVVTKEGTLKHKFSKILFNITLVSWYKCNLISVSVTCPICGVYPCTECFLALEVPEIIDNDIENSMASHFLKQETKICTQCRRGQAVHKTQHTHFPPCLIVHSKQ